MQFKMQYNHYENNFLCRTYEIANLLQLSRYI